MTRLYDTIGGGYGNVRRQDPRLFAAVLSALGDVRTVVNVGAGGGSYEPRDRSVVGVDESLVMLRQRPRGAGPGVLGDASALPFPDGSFDAALAVLTVHHWNDQARGLLELRRVTRDRVVLLTWDPRACDFWLFDYLPEIPVQDAPLFPWTSELERTLGTVEVRPVPVPGDCTDGFLCAYWRRPAAYLDPKVRAGISCFARLGSPEAGLDRLRSDLESGVWENRYGHLLAEETLDLGYRLVVATWSARHTGRPGPAITRARSR